MTDKKYDLESVARRFQIQGDFLEAAPYGTGHINDTYAVVFDQAGASNRYIFQRINTHIFKNPGAVMENVGRVTAHVKEKLEIAGVKECSRRVLTLVPTRDGRRWDMDRDGNHWRCYLFIEKARTYDKLTSPSQAYEVAKSFGAFQKMLVDVPPPRLRDTVPHFHNTRMRFSAFQEAVKADSCGRAKDVQEEIQFCLYHEAIVDVLLNRQQSGDIPERVTHNDTKLDNVMLDDATGEGICVIDLDTVMPGLVLYDFGDMCRTACCLNAEDERDLSRVAVCLDMFEALARGYIAEAGDFLNEAEKQHLVFSARLITFEVGMRFLTDYLEGDHYFKVQRPGHNLDRARVQFKMVQSFEQEETAMNRIIQECIGRKLE